MDADDLKQVYADAYRARGRQQTSFQKMPKLVKEIARKGAALEGIRPAEWLLLACIDRMEKLENV